jgi:hypothetical protein
MASKNRRKKSGRAVSTRVEKARQDAAESLGFIAIAKNWSRHPAEPWVWTSFAAAIALTLGYLTSWVVFEYDLFWHVRAGGEIMAGRGVQRVDGWSYTARGETWFNFQWLSTVVDYLVYRAAGGYGVFSWMRALLVSGWLFTLAIFVRKAAERTWSSWTLTLLLLPWIYLACVFRLQMRPDLFSICLYAAMISVWLSKLGPLAKRVTSIVILLAWANFHSGTSPFGVVFFFAAMWWDDQTPGKNTWVSRFGWSVVAALTWFITPIGWNVVAVAIAHLNYPQELRRNPDLQPFSFNLLEYKNGGWSLAFWTAYTVVAAFCIVRMILVRETALPGVYRRRGFVLVLAAFYTIMTLKNIRALHYQMVFLLPVVAAQFRSIVAFLSRNRAALVGAWLAFAIAVVSIGAIILPDQALYVSKPLGAYVYDAEIPVQSAAFIKRTRPAGHLFNAYEFGGYLIGELPEYPVAFDGRDIPFLSFFAENAEAKKSVKGYAAFLSRYDINAVIDSPPGMLYDPTKGFSDTHMYLYPPPEWAQVFFDNVSVVYLRRIEANRAIIAAHEYQLLRRGLPATFGARFQGVPDAVRAQYELEIDRCLKENPRSVFCMVGKASFYDVRKQHDRAIELLKQAREIDRHSVETLTELASIYEETGRARELAEVQHHIEKIATPVAP